jgi:OmcA/MtrC family decaheme c-type cytochrome
MHMANPYPSTRFLVLALATLTISFLVGCGGSSGSPGAPGPEGPPGSLGLSVTIDDVGISSTPVVDFTVRDQNGFAVRGITQASFTIAKLVPGQGGDSNAWQSYINRVEQPGVGDWPGTEPRVQAVAESTGVLEDNGDGTYRYTFATDLTAVTTPIPVTYQPELTHLVGVELDGFARGANAIYSFQPSTGNTVGIAARRIASQETCASCHGASLAAHGGRRVDAEYCVACHNPGTTDAQSDESLDLRVMVHRIHMGADLPTEPYVLWGFGDSRNDFSDVAHPQDVRNCVNCHDPDNPRTPQASQIQTHPSIAACGSCHADVNFETGENHIRGTNLPVANDACTACHSTGGIAGSVLESHEIPTKLASEAFQLNVLGLELQGEQALVTLSVANPQDGSTYELPGPFRALAARLHWTESNSSDYGRPFPRSANTARDDATPVGSGAYVVPIDIAGTNAPIDPSLFTVSLEGSAWLDGIEGGEVVRIAGATRFFSPSGVPDVVQRRDVVSDEACQSCHEQYEGPYSGHGQNRTDHVQMCVVCHNPSRASDDDGARLPYSGSTDMLQMIHGIHARDARENPYRERGANVRYPRPSSDCQACHIGDSYQLTRMPATKPATLTGSTGGEVFTSPQTAVCWSCHNSAISIQHMEQNGGQINISQAELLTPSQESCSICHGPGRSADVQRLHGVP